MLSDNFTVSSDDMKYKRILLTGAAGFMGSHIFKSLLDNGFKFVLGVDDLSGGFLRNIPKGAAFKKLDLKNPWDTESLIEKFKPQIIFHLAASAREGASGFQPRYITQCNLEAYINVLTPAIKHGLEKMILFSTMATYGNQTPPFDETLERKPVDIYGINKAAMEQYTEILSGLYGFTYTIIRPHNVTGSHQSLSDKFRNVVGIFMNRIMRREPLIIYGDGCTTAKSQTIVDSKLTSMENLWDALALTHTIQKNILNNTPSEIITVSGINTLSKTKDNNLKLENIEAMHKQKYTGEIFNIQTKISEVELTPWHPTYIFNGETILEKRADEITQDDVIIVPKINFDFGKDIVLDNIKFNKCQSCGYTWLALKTDYVKIQCPKCSATSKVKLKQESLVFSEDEAWLTGVFLGDGHWTQSKPLIGRGKFKKYGDKLHVENKVCLTGGESKIDVLKYAKKISCKFTNMPTKDTIHKHTSDIGTWYTVSLSCKLRFMLQELGAVHGKKAYTVRIPSIIFSTKKEIKYAFLAGLVDTDGFISDSKLHIDVMSTRSKEMAYDIQRLLLTLGVLSTVIYRKNKAYEVGLNDARAKLFAGQILKYLKNKKHVQRLSKFTSSTCKTNSNIDLCNISIKNLNKWLYALKFYDPKNKSKYIMDETLTFHAANLYGGHWIDRTRLEYILNKAYERACSTNSAYKEEIFKCQTIVQNFYFQKITKIEKIQYDGYVYDFTIKNSESNNYISGIKGFGLVHNTQQRSFSGIEYSLPCYLKCLELKTNEIVNIGGKYPITVLDMAKEVIEAMGEKADYPIKFLPDRPLEVKYAFSTYKKSQDLLGYSEPVDGWKAAVWKMASWAKTLGPQEWTTDALELINGKTPKSWLPGFDPHSL